MRADCAVLFDIGGVLEHTPDLGVRATWEARLGLDPGALDPVLQPVWAAGSVGRISEAAVHAELGARLGLDPDGVQAFMADVWREYLGTPNLTLLAYVRSLRARVRTGIVSNSFVGAREREEGHLGLSGLGEVVVYSHEVGLWKPDPAIYTYALDQLGLPASRVAFVDDLPENVEAAEQLGMTGVLHWDDDETIAAVERFLAVV
ncbi:MAG: HAD family phosphatase [Myxococcota bacterium]